MELNKIYLGDCLEVMKNIDDKSIDMILCDLPYGITACNWDTIIPFDPLWEHYKRIIKDNGAIVLTASQPFTSKLVMSNIKMFKYEWIWNKSMTTGFLNANRMPLKEHEDILIFYSKQPTYNPVKTKCKRRLVSMGVNSENYGKFTQKSYYSDEQFPRSIINITQKLNKNGHPTQKPVALFEYLIKAYTNEGDLVLDNCIGSGTTAIACLKTGRNYIGIEKEKKYFDMANNRIELENRQLKLAL